ncbi:hypothetical protein PUN28_018899 [Cardiocondyla obscurior]|uniref:Uncharacterized protein n=1 Tax=Cardiocondyla obscurior TaxID=286306 RepID=A0AAW2ECH4_9HYME
MSRRRCAEQSARSLSDTYSYKLTAVHQTRRVCNTGCIFLIQRDVIGICKKKKEKEKNRSNSSKRSIISETR